MSELKKTLTEQIGSGEMPSVAVTYKDRIFRMIFKNKEEFLVLYNAMNNTHYNNPGDLFVSALDNAIYLSMKNDVSFVLYDRLMLYEHQSTKNPNMPLRSLYYVADVYSKLTKDKNIFGGRLIKIPEPKFAVFYNGVDRMPERSTLRLSEMFENASEQPALELITQIYNINLGYNKELMENCKTLRDYAVFVDLVRKYQKELPLKEAITKAIDVCIETGVLADFLRANKAEVLKMGLYEYDEEKHIRMEREDAWEEGRLEGREEGKLEGREEGRLEGREEGRLEGREEGRLEGREEERQISIINIIGTSKELGASREDTARRLRERYTLSEDEAEKYIACYWKES